METPVRTAMLCGKVNVRPNPAPNGGVLRTLVEGQSVTVYEWRGRWARIGNGEWIVAAVLCRGGVVVKTSPE